MSKKSYQEKLRDPRWQKKRLQILERDNWECQICCDVESTLHVHHRRYERGQDPWDTPDDLLVTVCEYCHRTESESRSEMESILLKALRRHFWYSDIEYLAMAFEDMELVHFPAVIANALYHLIRDKEKLKALVDNYLDELDPSSSKGG